MAITAAYEAIRRCTGIRADGQPCEGWATWDSDDQVCIRHGPGGHRGPRRSRLEALDAWIAAGRNRPRAKAPPCRCAAYGFPHRPGGGKCSWPLVGTDQAASSR